MKRFRLPLLAAALAASAQVLAAPPLLNVSYDVMRDFYKDYNPAFQARWKAEHGDTPVIQMSHGGSSKQARAVIDGLQADVITMNQATDIQALADRGLVPKDWENRLPDRSAPFTSATVLIVRQGNPKGIHDWSDLLKDGVQVIVPNPKTSGNGRYTYLSAWAYALRQPGGDEQTARSFVGELFKHVPILDTGGRAATTTFMKNQQGDVLVTFENEAEMIAREFGRGGFEVVYPSLSVQAEPPVSVVDSVVDKKGTRAEAEEYLKYLWSEEGQKIAADNFLRPRNASVLARYADRFPKLELIDAQQEFGPWASIQKTHFADGGVFDQLYMPQ
ncbi:sulfate ABC transporter substrate-binding protein [Pseudomonas oryzihabitans]|uniref:sulfate ABC transporter substrate-binding protein n=1 Tax=Pseudomonas oryzihabitans TaxID=47885 RepID=UPI0011A7FB81|nr:sulfate ABC transporter substrate-binding protein [Pseudomonas psychrotolerans]